MGPVASKVARAILLVAAWLEITLVPCYVSTKENLADHPSRGETYVGIARAIDRRETSEPWLACKAAVPQLREVVPDDTAEFFGAVASDLRSGGLSASTLARVFKLW